MAEEIKKVKEQFRATDQAVAGEAKDAKAFGDDDVDAEVIRVKKG